MCDADTRGSLLDGDQIQDEEEEEEKGCAEPFFLGVTEASEMSEVFVIGVLARVVGPPHS